MRDALLMKMLKIFSLIKKPLTWLILLYCLSVIIKIFLSFFVKSPYIYLDELIYSKMAESFFETGKFLYRGMPTNQYPPLYPIVLSTAFIFKDMAATYAVMKIINAFLSSLIIIPVWLLSRNFLNEKESITLAIFSLIFPFFIYSNVIMSENLFYPLFIISIYLIYESVLKGNLKTDILCGFSIGLLFLTKITGILLLITFIMGLLIEIIIKLKDKDDDKPELKKINYVRIFIQDILQVIKRKMAVFLAFGLIILPWLIRNALLFGFSMKGMLGGYSNEVEVIETFQFSFTSFLSFIFIHFSYLIIASGIIFFVGSIILLCSFLNKKQLPEESKRLLIFASISWISAFLLVITSSYHVYVTSIMIEGYHRIQGRYVDPVLPLFLIMGFIGLKQILIVQESKFFKKCLFVSILISSFLLIFSPLNFLNEQAITSTPGILFLNVFKSLNISMVIVKLFLIVMPFTFLILYRFGILRIEYLTPIFVAFLLASSSAAYLYNVNMSHWIDNDMAIGKWLQSNDKHVSAILLDERDKDKSLLVQWGIEFWTNDKIIVGEASANNNSYDYLLSSFDMNYQKKIKNAKWYLYDLHQSD